MSKPLMGHIGQFRKALVSRSQSGFVSSLQTVLANILVLFINVATGIITARLLGPNDKGVQAAIILWPGLLISLSMIGLPTALLYYIKKTTERTGAFLAAALVLGVAASLVAGAVGVLFVPSWLNNYSVQTVRIAQLYMLFIPVAVLNNVYTSVVQATGNFHIYNGLRLLQPAVSLTILLLLALTGTMTSTSAAFAFMCPSIPAFFWLWLFIRRHYKFSFSHLGDVYTKLLSYGVRSYSGDILAIASSQLDKIVIVSLLSPTSMGLYTIAFSLAKMLVVFESAVGSVLLPKIIGQPISEVRLLLGRAVRVSTLVTAVAAAVLMSIGPFLINLFYGDAFQGAIIVFWILAVDSVLGGLAALLDQTFYALGKPEIMIFRHTISLAVAIPGMLILGNRYGIAGVASAVLLESMVMTVLTLTAFPTLLKVPAPSLWAPKEDLAYMSKLWVEWRT